MTTTLLSDRIWPRLRELAKRHRGFVAVPYFGPQASSLLPLRQGSTLVVQCSESCVQAGQVSPAELLKLLGNRVDIHCCQNLHAKVFVFGRRAIVGSTNISSRSANTLIEAGIETSDPGVVTACKEFVLSLRGDRASESRLRELLKLFHYPTAAPVKSRRPPTRHIPAHSALWVVPLEPAPYDKLEKENARRARAQAKEAADLSTETLYDFTWYGSGGLLKHLRPGHRVLVCMAKQRKVSVSPPARVLAIATFRHQRQVRGVVATALPKGKRWRSLERVLETIGPAAKVLTDRGNAKRLRDGELVLSLGQLWS